jgi:hypothetical protein
MLPSTMPITLAARRPSRRSRLALAALALLGSMPGALSPSAAQAAPPPPVPPPVLVPIPFPPRDLQVEDIEITQSQQYLNNATYADNSLPGVDRRTTTVRVTVKVSGWLPLPVSNVQGRLQIFQGATQIHDLLSDNGPITAPIVPDRNNASHSLNFTFLPGDGAILALFGRTLSFTATVDPFNTIAEFNEANNTKTTSKSFGCRRTPLVMGVPIDYSAATEPDATTLGVPDPNLIAQGVGDAFLWGAYPFPEYTAGANGQYRIYNGPAFPWASNIDSSGSALLTDLDTFRVAQSPVPDHIYGWFRGNPFSGNGLGMVGGPAAFGNTDPTRHQRTFAHELGHNFGFLHNRAETGTIITTINETGWDTLNRVNLGELKSSTLMDIMVPGLLTHEAWVHPQTYQDVYDDQTNSCIVFIPIPIDLFTLSAIVPPDPRQKWTIPSPFQLTSLTQPPRPVDKGRGQVRVLDREGRALYTTAFDVRSPGDHQDSRGEQPGPTAVSLTLPAMANAASIDIAYDGELRQRLQRSPNAPRVQVDFAQVSDDSLALAFKSDDADGDALQTMVRYTPDGRSFYPLAVRPRGNQLRLSLRGLPASDKGAIEVLVTDGFNTGRALVEGLAIGKNHAPEVAIVRPHTGDEYRAGANVVLVSAVDDAEDGEVPGERIVWSSSQDGTIGNGQALNTSKLSAGEHTIQVAATDSMGARSTAAVKITVR